MKCVGHQLLLVRSDGPISQDIWPDKEEREQDSEVHTGERGFHEARGRTRGLFPTRTGLNVPIHTAPKPGGLPSYNSTKRLTL
jgi:hypothetical protein